MVNILKYNMIAGAFLLIILIITMISIFEMSIPVFSDEISNIMQFTKIKGWIIVSNSSGTYRLQFEFRSRDNYIYCRLANTYAEINVQGKTGTICTSDEGCFTVETPEGKNVAAALAGLYCTFAIFALFPYGVGMTIWDEINKGNMEIAKNAEVNPIEVQINGVFKNGYRIEALITVKDSTDIPSNLSTQIVVAEIEPDTYIVTSALITIGTSSLKDEITEIEYEGKQYIIGPIKPITKFIFKLYEESIDELGHVTISPLSDADIVVKRINPSNEWLLKSDLRGVVRDIPWFNETSGKYSEGVYKITVSKKYQGLKPITGMDSEYEENPFVKKFGTDELFPVNTLYIVVKKDENGNVDIGVDLDRKCLSYQDIHIRNNGTHIILEATIKSILSWDNYGRSKLMLFLRDVGISSTKIDEILSIPTVYGRGEDQYIPPPSNVVQYKDTAGDFYMWDNRTIGLDLQTFYHEWGHAIKEKLLADPDVDLGGVHEKTYLPASSMELAYDEGHAEFFACLLLDYIGLNFFKPHDRYQGPEYLSTRYAKEANYIEGRIAGYWLSIYGLSQRSLSSTQVVNAYRDFLKISKVFKALIGHFPRRIHEWIYMKIAMLPNLNEIRRVIREANKRKFSMPHLFYREMPYVEGEVSGKSFIIMGALSITSNDGFKSVSLKGTTKDRLIGVAVFNVGDKIMGESQTVVSTTTMEPTLIAGGQILLMNSITGDIETTIDISEGTELIVEKDSFRINDKGAIHVNSHGKGLKVNALGYSCIANSDFEIRVINRDKAIITVLEGDVVITNNITSINVNGGTYVTILGKEISEPTPIKEVNKWWTSDVKKLKELTETTNVTTKIREEEESTEIKKHITEFENKSLLNTIIDFAKKYINIAKQHELELIFASIVLTVLIATAIVIKHKK